MSDRVDKIRQAFYKQFGTSNMSFNGWVEDVYEDYVVANVDGQKYAVEYTETEDGCDFGDVSEWKKVKEVYVDEKSDTVSKALTKSESWGDEPASSYLIVADRKHPTDWHLPVKKHGKLDRGLMGAAHAALVGGEGGHRGNAYGGPGKGKAIAKLKNLYRSEGMDWETKSDVTEDSMAGVNETSGKKKSTKPKEVDSFEDEERVEEGEEAYGQGKGAKSKAMRKGDEPETEAEDKEETEADEKAEDKQAKKSLLSRFSKVADKVLEVRSAGLVGKEAEAALQPLLNEVGAEIEKALQPSSDSAVLSALSEITRTLAAQNELLMNTAKEVAVLKAGTGQTPRIPSPFIPAPRSVKVEKSNPTKPVRKLSQIEEIARRSTGLPVDE